MCVSVGRGGGAVTPLVTVTHYLSHPPSLHCESDVIVVIRECCIGNPKICALSPPDLYVVFSVMMILKY